jgi:hypothetical protein
MYVRNRRIGAEGYAGDINSSSVVDDPFRDWAPFMSRPPRSVSGMNDCPECDHPVIYHVEHGCFAAPDCDSTEQSDRVS